MNYKKKFNKIESQRYSALFLYQSETFNDKYTISKSSVLFLCKSTLLCTAYKQVPVFPTR